MQLETERLVLREMESADYAGLCRILQDPAVMYAYEHAFSDEETHAWLHNQQRRYREDGFGLWAMVRKDSGEMCGQCGLTWQDWNGERVLEIGYLLEKNAWGQGFATEAATCCKHYAFDKLCACAVYAIIRDTNLPSQRVAQRIGMHVKGELLKHYYQMEMPHLVFGIDRDECALSGVSQGV